MKLSNAFQGRQRPEIVRSFNDNPDTSTDESVSQPPGSDAELLDGYSQTVARVVEKIKPAVVNIRIRRDGANRSRALTRFNADWSRRKSE
jgi:hypothetical protein